MTLIEILVAILLFAVGALALARMQIVSLRGNAFGREAMIATTAAQRQIEQLRNRNINPFASLIDQEGDVAIPEVPGMNVHWQTQVVSGTVTPNRTMDIAVQVTWRGQALNFNTVISEQ